MRLGATTSTSADPASTPTVLERARVLVMLRRSPRGRFAVLCVAIAISCSCGSSTPSTPATQRNEPCSSADSCVEDLSKSDAAAAVSDSSTPSVTGRAYDDEPYHCCAEDEGTGCCGGYKQGMCFQFGGSYGACRAEGSQISGKVPCSFCCTGLQASQIYTLTDAVVDGYPKGCGPSSTPPDLMVCIRCGDGTCGAAENRCSCPADCE